MIRTSAIIAGLLALGLGAAAWWLQGPLPGDVALSRALQSLVPSCAVWIWPLSATVTWPWIIATALGVMVFAAAVAGLRGALATAAGMAIAVGLEKLGRALVHVPRPSPELVEVASPSASSGLPSTFAIFYGAAMGALVMLARAKSGREALLVRWAALVLLVVGCAGRVAAGGHWTSQVIASAAAGWLASLIALRLFGLAKR